METQVNTTRKSMLSLSNVVGGFFLFWGLLFGYEACVDWIAVSGQATIVAAAATSFLLLTLAFSILSPWRRLNKLVGGVVLLTIAFWLIFESTTHGYEGSTIWLIAFEIAASLWGASLICAFLGVSLQKPMLHIYNKLVARSITFTAGYLQFLSPFGVAMLKFLGFSLLLIVSALILGVLIWLALAIGPLWTIVLLLVPLAFYAIAKLVGE